jgi:hypothetical protein
MQMFRGIQSYLLSARRSKSAESKHVFNETSPGFRVHRRKSFQQSTSSESFSSAELTSSVTH